jgi:hypothetical protein
MHPSLQAVPPYGEVSVLGDSAGAYCAVAQAQSLSQVKLAAVFFAMVRRLYSWLYLFFPSAAAAAAAASVIDTE